ncbi:MAG: Fic family protein [Pseudonocardiaceae bacterium]
MDDFVQYTNGGAHAALIQGALVHAQFETIYPYTDGNGRVGRALIHTVLTRRGLIPSAVLPLSLVLLASDQGSLDPRPIGTVSLPTGTMAQRHQPMPVRSGNVGLWTFLDAAEPAVDQVVRFTSESAELRARWREQLAARRSTHPAGPAG